MRDDVRCRVVGGAILVLPFVWQALIATAGAELPAYRRTRFAQQISADPLAGAGGSQPDTQAEPHVAIDPGDPSIVVAVFQQGRFVDGGSADPGFASSRDGGQTWQSGSLPGLTVAVGGSFERASDPVVVIGADGAVYAQTIPFDAAGCPSAVAVQRSDDGGQSFGPPLLVQSDNDCSIFNDKNWLAVDTFAASPYFGRLYSVWTRNSVGSPVVLRSSDDRGDSWSSLVQVSDPAPGAVGALPLVQPTGDVTIVYYRFDGSEVSQTSHDGGTTFDPPVVVDTFQGSGPPDMRTGGLPAATVDPVTGTLYVVWQDTRFRTDGLNDIVLSFSLDGGASWASLRPVNPPRPLRRDQFTPAVAAYEGYVHVTYVSRRRLGARLWDRVDTRYLVSADGGTTFGRERRLGRRGDLDFAAMAGGRLFLGDYMGLAAVADTVHAVWCRPSRTTPPAPHQTTWSATILR